MKKVTVLGSTGSIGRQALDVIRSHPGEFCVFALSAGNNTDLLQAQIEEFCPLAVASARKDAGLDQFKQVEFFFGQDAAKEVAGLPEADIVVNGISGIAALEPLLASLRQGKRVALANKESIVCGHTLVEEAIACHHGEILPVDSEQSAIYQCLQNGRKTELDRLILTASGGPFWKLSKEELSDITLEQALQHPTWSMGKKITIDSATLFNKGLEVLEAAYLFDVPGEQIEVVIHPQSIVHSMVAYRDGTVMANLSNPDMRLPIQYAMTYPDRIESSCKRLSLAEIGTLSFHAADRGRFTALRLAYDALAAGKSMPVVYNGANEAAVEHFFRGALRFSEIENAVGAALAAHSIHEITDIEDIWAADAASRNAVAAFCREKGTV